MDRFLIRIRMGYPSRETEKEILRSQANAHSGAGVQPVMEASDVLAMQQAAASVRVDESLLDYALEIVEKTRQNERLILGVSPRGSLMLQRAAQARAFIEGRDFCLPDDFKQLVLPVFAHRVVVNARYATTQKKTSQAESILAEIVESTPVPL
jgi:MoxR-like ATPase